MKIRIDRRKLAGIFAVGASTAFLAKCAAPGTSTTGGTTTSTNLQQAQSYTAILSAGATSILSVIGKITGMSPTTLQRFTTDVSQITTFASDIIGAATQQAASGFGSGFNSAVQQFLTDLGASSGLFPSSVGSAISDISTIAPVILTLLETFGVVAATAPPNVSKSVSDLNNFIHSAH